MPKKVEFNQCSCVPCGYTEYPEMVDFRKIVPGKRCTQAMVILSEDRPDNTDIVTHSITALPGEWSAIVIGGGEGVLAGASFDLHNGKVFNKREHCIYAEARMDIGGIVTCTIKFKITMPSYVWYIRPMVNRGRVGTLPAGNGRAGLFLSHPPGFELPEHWHTKHAKRMHIKQAEKPRRQLRLI